MYSTNLFLSSFDTSNKKILESYENRKPIAPLIVSKNNLCDNLDKYIRNKNLIGKGLFGDAYNISFGKNTSTYVAKRQFIFVSRKMASDIAIVKGNITIGEFIRKILVEIEIEYYNLASVNKNFIYEFLISINGRNSRLNKFVKNNTKFFVPDENVYSCLTKKDFPILIKGYRSIIITPGNYVCENPIFSEYLIDILVSTLYREGKTIGVLDKFGYNSCPDKKEQKFLIYILMEKMDGSMKTLMQKFPNDFLPYFIQIVHTIGTYQYYGICHQDLHMENILYKKIDKITKFRGQYLHSAKWFHYRYKSTNLYVPATKYIMKIIDFGLAVKWSEPMICNLDSLDRNYHPNFFQEFGDITHLLARSKMSIIKNTLSLLGLTDNIKSKFKRILTPGHDKNMNPPLEEIWGEFESKITPQKIFENKNILRLYGTKPKVGKIITLGTM